MTLQTRLYEHAYGSFQSDFNTDALPGCTYDVKAWTPNMVGDYLYYDSLLDKKMISSGKRALCSGTTAQWFDPRLADTTICGSLTLKPKWPDSLGASGYSFIDSVFHPVDSISRELNATNRSGTRLNHDFSYCMEMNAALVYHGGETLRFQGDDDLWVFIDNQLAADMGGIHFALEKRVELDSLAFLQGRQGDTLDFDLYFCSRIPPSSIFGLDAPVELIPRPIHRLTLVDTADRPVASNDLVVGKTRLCTRADYLRNGSTSCGNAEATPPHPLADWEINGSRISRSGGQACIDLDPSGFPDSTRISLTARAKNRSARIALTLVRPAQPRVAWLRGSGRAEALEVRLDSAGGKAPEGLSVAFTLEGASRMAYVEATSATRQLPTQDQILTGFLPVSQYGPMGLTDPHGLLATVRQNVVGKTFVRQLPLRDGIRPILLGARLRWTGSDIASDPAHACGGFPAAIDLDLSEPVYPEGLALGLFIAKLRDGRQVDLATYGAQCMVTDPRRRRLLLPEAFAAGLTTGDSVTLGPSASDSLGNPAATRFAALKIPDLTDAAPGEVRIRENPARGRPFTPQSNPTGSLTLLGIDSADRSLAPTLTANASTDAGGPVLLLPSPVPLEEIALHVFDHLGNFVGSVQRPVTDAEWLSAQRSSPTPLYRFMLYPATPSGRKLGTGVYILQGEGKTRDGAMLELQGEAFRVRGKAFRIKPMRFGWLRGD